MSAVPRRLVDLVGGKAATALETHLGIDSVEALLGHYPRRYEQRSQLTDLAGLEIGEHVTVTAEVRTAVTRDYLDKRTRRKRKRLEVMVTDGRRELQLVFFNQHYQAARLRPGTSGFFSGKVSVFRERHQLLHPDFQLFDDAEGGPDGDADRAAGSAPPAAKAVVPVYPATEKLQSWTIERCVEAVLPYVDELSDPLPAAVRDQQGLLTYAQALRQLHAPASMAEVARAQERLRFDEAFLVQAVLARQRLAHEQVRAVARPARSGRLLDAFDALLPFELTDGQRRVGEQMAAELAREHPLHRLLQGEVGSGKTVVALRAMLQVVDAGGQAALLAPTEVLAQQHHRSISAMLGPLARPGTFDGAEHATGVALLTGSSGVRARREALLDAQSGAAGIVIGTHALLQDRVQFAELGLVVVDEQHRFGVEQRAALSARAGSDTRPHTLVMTATPIPRTVAMTVFGDLDTSTLSELPAGRQQVQTTVVPVRSRPDWVERAWQRVREEVEQGHQAYVVCARIGDGEDAGVTDADSPQSAVETHAELVDGPLRGLRLGLLHGRLPAEEKDAVMSQFAAGTLDVLVSTTVIEVGVDVPNATTMVIHDAERFGISQLHQLRGRIGRGGLPGLCLLMTRSGAHGAAQERLAAVAATQDGFELARTDLRTRREGDVLGASQSGRRSALRLLSVLDHEDVIAAARVSAEHLVRTDPELTSAPGLEPMVRRFETSQAADFLEKG